MFQRAAYFCLRKSIPVSVCVVCVLLALAACTGGTASPGATHGPPTLAPRQVLRFPNVGIADANSAFLDPAQGPDVNTAQVVNMIYSGLVRSDANLNVAPDQAASWDVSADSRVYTFHLRSGLAFSDGTPITAETYVYTLTRALLPAVKSPIASFFESNIKGQADVSSGKATTLAGVRALDSQTLQITLTQPTPYFLEEMTNSAYFPLNRGVIDRYGQTDWPNHVAGSAVGSGPFMVREWDHKVKMVLVPNPHYYGARTRLTEVDMSFVVDQTTAFRAFEAKQYDFTWNITPGDQSTAQHMAGFTRRSLLQTDLLFFNNKMAPFNKAAVRQAFAYAIDKNALVQAVLKDAAVVAPTIIPPGMPSYQPAYPGIPYDRARAKGLLQSVYPAGSLLPAVTFAFPNSQVTPSEAAALQQMWQEALGIQVNLRPVDLTAYNTETANHQIQFGFTQWSADFPDPYDWLALNLLSTAPNNSGDWSNATFDQMVAHAEQSTGVARINLYNQAEQLAIQDVGWLPLDHQALAEVIPAFIHGLILNGNGLYFGDWSDVYVLAH